MENRRDNHIRKSCCQGGVGEKNHQPPYQKALSYVTKVEGGASWYAVRAKKEVVKKKVLEEFGLWLDKFWKRGLKKKKR